MRISAFILFLPFPLELIFEIAGPEKAKNPAVLRLIQIRFTDAEAAGNSTCLSIQFASRSSTHQAKNFDCLRRAVPLG
jgi:hypothetical protein